MITMILGRTMSNYNETKRRRQFCNTILFYIKTEVKNYNYYNTMFTTRINGTRKLMSNECVTN